MVSYFIRWFDLPDEGDLLISPAALFRALGGPPVLPTFRWGGHIP